MLRSQPLCVFWASCFQSACSFHMFASDHIVNANDSILGLLFVDFCSLQRLVCLRRKGSPYDVSKHEDPTLTTCFFVDVSTPRTPQIHSNQN